MDENGPMLSTPQRAHPTDVFAPTTQLQFAVPLRQQQGRDTEAERERPLERVAFYLAWGSAASIIVSIALSQLLLGLALVVLVASGQRLRFPPVKVPLVLFFFATVLAVLASVNPAAGWPQVRKFFVFGIMLVVFNTFRTLSQIRSLVLAWAGLALLSAGASFIQLQHRHQLALAQNANDYGFYLDGRITGFASHWMTFGAEQMIVLLMLLSFLLFSPDRKGKMLALIGIPVLWLSIVLGLTRSIFMLGVPVGAVYLFSVRKRWIVAVIALTVALAAVVTPFHVRDRVVSAVQPHKEVDSNLRRVIMIRTGWEMVKAHPWLGLGPEQTGPQFMSYVPKDVARPLPKGWYGHLHNMYLQYAAERGIPALLLLLWFIGKVAHDFLTPLRSGRLDSQAYYCLYGAIAVILALLAEGFFEYNLGDSEVLTMFLTVISCGYVAIEVSNQENRGASRPTTKLAT